MSDDETGLKSILVQMRIFVILYIFTFVIKSLQIKKINNFDIVTQSAISCSTKC